MSPKWELITSQLGRPVPAILHSLYDRPEGVFHSNFRLTPPDGAPALGLDLFLPMDEEAVAPDGVRLPPGAVAFADDEHGDPYVFVPDATPEGDGPVYLSQHRQGEDTLVLVAPALSTFLAWERRRSH